MAVGQNSCYPVEHRNLLEKNFLIFIEIQKYKLCCHFSITPLDGLAHSAHSPVEGNLVRRKHRATIELLDKPPQGVGRVSINYEDAVLNKLFQLVIKATVPQYTWKVT